MKATWVHPRSKHWHLLDYVKKGKEREKRGTGTSFFLLQALFVQSMNADEINK